MSIEQKIIELIEPSVTSLEYELVRVKQIDKDTIQIMIDGESGVNVDDCAKISRLAKNILYVEEGLSEFGLEVTSPGIDRPLIKIEHYSKSIGQRVKLATQMLIDGQKRFNGILTEVDSENNKITLTCGNKAVVIELDQVQSANIQYEPTTNNGKKI
jgi:ribosome maturation factor RimP